MAGLLLELDNGVTGVVDNGTGGLVGEVQICGAHTFCLSIDFRLLISLPKLIALGLSFRSKVTKIYIP